MINREITIAAGDIAKCALNEDDESRVEQVLVLYPSPGNTVEIIPFDGTNLIGLIGGGVSINTILEIVDHLDEETYVRLISRGKVGHKDKAREIYKRPPITYTLNR